MPTITVDDEALAVIREATRIYSEDRRRPLHARSVAFDVWAALEGSTDRLTNVTVEVQHG